MCHMIEYCILWRVPDRRSVGAFLGRHRDIGRHFDSETQCFVSGPARRRNLENSSVIKSGQARVKVRVGPDANELRRTNRVTPRSPFLHSPCCRLAEVYHPAPGFRSPLQTTSYTFSSVLPSLFMPALDDLDAIEVAAIGVFQWRRPGSLETSRPEPCVSRRPSARLWHNRHRLATGVSVSSAVKSQPPKKRTVMRLPVVA